MEKKERKTGLIFFPAFDWAISPTHPEREERLLYTQDQVAEEGLLDLAELLEFKPRMASLEDVSRTHICVPDPQSITSEPHLISVGGAITAAEKVLTKEADNAFALVRPPGHHAMLVVHGARGFCNINNEAIMVDYIRKRFGLRKIALVDTDCHHGDGTQDIFWHDPDVLCISLHQDGRTLYPGSGFPEEMGGPNALGATINIPLPPRTSDEGFLYVMDHLVRPVLDEFQPELIINSAGQDNHYSDPITNMSFSAQGYARLVDRLGAQIAVLEGGYSIEAALPYVNVGIILAMAGLDYSHVREPDYDPDALRQSGETTRYIEQISGQILKRWENREEMRKKVILDKRLLTRHKSIYYDTDGIRETQEETVRICHDCGGLVTIDSRADTGRHIFAVIIPRHACGACRDAGEAAYGKTKPGEYEAVYLQDKGKDVFLKKSGGK
ncbi:MAG: histone deacetylase [Smithellaceae bacterium]|nr:histone deacetylase [Smithellaceae bacterium]